MNNRRTFKGDTTIGDLLDQFEKKGTTVTIERGRITEIQMEGVILQYRSEGCGSVVLHKPSAWEKKRRTIREICLGK